MNFGTHTLDLLSQNNPEIFALSNTTSNAFISFYDGGSNYIVGSSNKTFSILNRSWEFGIRNGEFLQLILLIQIFLLVIKILQIYQILILQEGYIKVDYLINHHNGHQHQIKML